MTFGDWKSYTKNFEQNYKYLNKGEQDSHI